MTIAEPAGGVNGRRSCLRGIARSAIGIVGVGTEERHEIRSTLKNADFNVKVIH
jgi:hypothetical protein